MILSFCKAPNVSDVTWMTWSCPLFAVEAPDVKESPDSDVSYIRVEPCQLPIFLGITKPVAAYLLTRSKGA